MHRWKTKNVQKPAQAIQLVHTDDSGQLQLDESAVQTCFLEGEISDLPVCLICVIGEKRRGKSFLLNYILRALSCREEGRPLSLGADDAPLGGFEWRDGMISTTKGIWIWSKPFILENKGENMAVFVLDTEGSLDIKSSRDICLKLSGLSMILSSYLIFNVNSNLKTTEMDYLEMYLDVAEKVGRSFDLQALQHLNILIRDWQDFTRCGKEDARAYVFHETENLQNDPSYRLVSETLRGPLADCSLLPHPGKGLLTGSQGKLSDMDEDFRNLLTNYIFTLVGDLWLHRKTDRQGEHMTCAQLGNILKRVVNILQNVQYSFASPLQMLFTFENHKNMERVKEQFQGYIRSMSKEASVLRRGRNVSPSQMESNVKEKATKFLGDFTQSIQGDDAQEKERLVKELEQFLAKLQQKHCKDYSKRFYGFRNQKNMENIKEQFQTEITLKSKEVESLIKEQTVSPARMESSINDTATGLLCSFKQSLQGDDTEEKKRLEKDLESCFLEQQQKFCLDYSQRFYGFKNQKMMENTKEKLHINITIKELEKFKLIRRGQHPFRVNYDLRSAANELLDDYRECLEGIDDHQTQLLVEEMEFYFSQKIETFCNMYSKVFNAWTSIERTMRTFKVYLNQMKEETSSLWNPLMVIPSVIESKIKDRVNEYLVAFMSSLEGINKEDRKILVDELKSHLDQKQEEFCKEYSSDYSSKIQGIIGGVTTTLLAAKGLSARASLVAVAAEAPLLATVVGGAVIVGTIVVLGRTYYVMRQRNNP
ncbi:RING finger protein 112-like [Xenopus tropicalis]|uniref:RING finger protein 112-like n=1 Tax=Xenopus tropicalis TaxID=8364 RepID=A0A8J1IUG0_XENTR|nr:RING finger protein 112-like [Xenopus tropicalis]